MPPELDELGFVEGLTDNDKSKFSKEFGIEEDGIYFIKGQNKQKVLQVFNEIAARVMALSLDGKRSSLIVLVHGQIF